MKLIRVYLVTKSIKMRPIGCIKGKKTEDGKVWFNPETGLIYHLQVTYGYPILTTFHVGNIPYNTILIYSVAYFHGEQETVKIQDIMDEYKKLIEKTIKVKEAV